MPASLLCETVTGGSMADLLAARDAATTGDMVELRLDGVADLDVAGALHGRRRPAVVTCRPRWEGGRFDGAEEERQRILARAMELGAEYVDVEFRALAEGRGGFAAIVEQDPARVLVSSHDFESVPPDLEDRARAMRATGARTIKLAAAVRRLSDTLRLLPVARNGAAVVIGMGEGGIPSRLLAAKYGSAWTYAGDGVAPGQLPARRMVEDYGFRRVRESSRLFGVVSSNALHSLSPVMHNAAFEAESLDAVYVPFTVHQFDDFLEFAAAMGVEGASVTIPFKLDAFEAARSRDEIAQRAGAVNTLRRRDGQWEGTNTDVQGFLAPLQAMLGGPVAGMRASVLGGGGAARAAVLALVSSGAQVTVHARRPEQAGEIAAAFGVAVGPYPPEPGSWDVLVNATPLGGAGLRSESPMPGGCFSGRLVYDLTYGPDDSPFLRDARDAGCATLDGLPMLVAQAERQFEYWTGRRPRPGLMEAAVRRAGARRDAAHEATAQNTT